MKANSNTNNFTKDLHVFVFSWYMCIPCACPVPMEVKEGVGSSGCGAQEGYK